MTATQDPHATARRLVEANSYMTLATAYADGRPWASPVWYAPVGDGDFLWVSDPEGGEGGEQAAGERPEAPGGERKPPPGLWTPGSG